MNKKTEYINKDTVRGQIFAIYRTMEMYGQKPNEALILKSIDNTIAADVRPERYAIYDWVDEDTDYAQCSCCSFQVEHPLFNDFNYCPYCGAKLDGERSGANV